MSLPGTNEDIAMLQQDYLKRLLESDEMFDDVPVISEDEGNIVSEMDKALGITTRKLNGKCGACVILRQPVGDSPKEVRNYPLDVAWEALCIEHRELNKDRDKGGTGKRAWHLARRVWTIVHLHRAPGLLQNITAQHPTISRYSAVREMNGIEIPLVGYAVRFRTPEADITSYQKVNLPALSGNPAMTAGVYFTGSAGTEVTVTCATPGAAIYYTSDLSNPCSQNPTATLYSGPFTAGSGTYLFRAFVSGMIGSDSAAALFT